MKMITAYIQSFMTEKVTDALRSANADGVTVLACQGFGRTTGRNALHYLDEGTRLGFVDKTKIEIVCADAAAEERIAIVRAHAHTGHHGDGKILVSDVLTAVDIRTGGREDAIRRSG